MSSVYLHVPFCRSRCPYCGFYSGESLDAVDRFVRAAVREIGLRAGEDRPPGPVDTVYLGGGTPSLLGPARVARLLTAVDRCWGVATGAEVTLEANPGGLPDPAGFRAAGITRLSLGVQALDDAVLSTLGRQHTAAEAENAVVRAVRTGFVSVGVDLICGVPDLAPGRLGEWVARLAALGATHLSAYSLEVHPGTPLAERVRTGAFRPAGEAEECAQWRAVAARARAEGFAPYELSNFARPGHESRHNRAYWTGRAYAGIGPGAHGFSPDLGPWGTRWWNAPELAGYLAALDRGRLPPGGADPLDRPAAVLEALFLWLRQPVPLEEGLRPERFGWSAGAVLRRLAPLVRSGDLAPGSLTPTPRGQRRADGLSLWCRDRLLGS